MREIVLHKTGKILRGEYQGGRVYILQDSSKDEDFFVFIAPPKNSPEFNPDWLWFDDWVQDMENLEYYFTVKEWEIDWNAYDDKPEMQFPPPETKT